MTAMSACDPPRWLKLMTVECPLPATVSQCGQGERGAALTQSANENVWPVFEKAEWVGETQIHLERRRLIVVDASARFVEVSCG
jgi:hypothetical protein